MSAARSRVWRTAAVVGAACGLLVAALMMDVAWEHTAQGEIHDESGVYWGYWLLVGSTWFVPVATSTGLVAGAFLAAVRRLQRS